MSIEGLRFKSIIQMLSMNKFPPGFFCKFSVLNCIWKAIDSNVNSTCILLIIIHFKIPNFVGEGGSVVNSTK